MSDPRAEPPAAEGPAGYRLDRTIDLKQDRHAAAVQVTALVAALLMVAAALLLDLPLDSSWSGVVVSVITVAACAVYMVVHELTHGAALALLTGVRPTFAVRLPFLVTGSPAFLTARQALAVALAPVVIWGVTLIAALFVVPDDLRLTLCVVLGLNFAGSAGDYVQARVISQLPSAALIRDDGNQTDVFVSR